MPLCKRCGKKGFFLRLEDKTGLCLSCKEEFNKKGRFLTEKITQAKNRAMLAKDPEEIIECCKEIDFYGNELISLQLAFTLQPSPELVDLMDAYKKVKEVAEKRLRP